MAHRPHEVHVPSARVGRFGAVLGAGAVQKAERTAEALRAHLAGRRIWVVNSTAAGGGVAEMLHSLIGYARGLGVDVRWLVIEGDAPFFAITKRLHHSLHGSTGDGSPLGSEQRALYERVLRDNAVALLAAVRPRDIVILHDPQTAGLAPALVEAGAIVVWRCHIGSDRVNAEVERGWAFLKPYLADAAALVFSRRAYAPPFCDPARLIVIPPSIDPFTLKNEALSEETEHAVLRRAGLIDGVAESATLSFAGIDGARRLAVRRADIVRLGSAPAWETPLIVQVSRWDPLKDHLGVMRGFALLAESRAPAGAQLVLAGPEVTGVADDPEAGAVLERLVAAWRELPEAIRGLVHLASLPTADVDENALIVNALQRHAAVVVQKSLGEGFGLTVTEAMWKGRPLVASAVGGIAEQITDGVHGLLVADPTDLPAFAGAVRRLLEDPGLARRLGANARERVRERFLTLRHLAQYADLLRQVSEWPRGS